MRGLVMFGLLKWSHKIRVCIIYKNASDPAQLQAHLHFSAEYTEAVSRTTASQWPQPTEKQNWDEHPSNLTPEPAHFPPYHTALVIYPSEVLASSRDKCESLETYKHPTGTLDLRMWITLTQQGSAGVNPFCNSKHIYT